MMIRISAADPGDHLAVAHQRAAGALKIAEKLAADPSLSPDEIIARKTPKLTQALHEAQFGDSRLGATNPAANASARRRAQEKLQHYTGQMLQLREAKRSGATATNVRSLRRAVEDLRLGKCPVDGLLVKRYYDFSKESSPFDRGRSLIIGDARPAPAVGDESSLSLPKEKAPSQPWEHDEEAFAGRLAAVHNRQSDHDRAVGLRHLVDELPRGGTEDERAALLVATDMLPQSHRDYPLRALIDTMPPETSFDEFDRVVESVGRLPAFESRDEYGRGVDARTDLYQSLADRLHASQQHRLALGTANTDEYRRTAERFSAKFDEFLEKRARESGNIGGYLEQAQAAYARRRDLTMLRRTLDLPMDPSRELGQ